MYLVDEHCHPHVKPKKPAEDSTSYRPVSLLCPAVKILEQLILPTLTKHLPIPAHQHGFRAKHSTIIALDVNNQQISQGFNKRKPANRTVLLMIDLSKEFNMVSHEKLLKDLIRSTLPESIKAGLTATYTEGNPEWGSEMQPPKQGMSKQVCHRVRSNPLSCSTIILPCSLSHHLVYI